MVKLLSMLKKFITNPAIRFSYLSALGVFDRVSDEKYLRMQYKSRCGVDLDLSNPRTFNEKLQWLKLYGRNPKYVKMVDKYEVRSFVSCTIGEKYLIPLLGVWKDPDQIDFQQLPEQFVLKCNHNSGLGMCICRDKSELDYDKVRRELARGLKQNYYLTSREWPYKDVPRRIIAEEFITDGIHKDLRDYKVFVFNGRPIYIQVDIDRFSNHRRNFYNTKWEYVPFTTCYPTAPEISIERPEKLEELLYLSEKLAAAAGYPPFLRVDMYILANRILFGEMTFFHGAGTERFYPDSYNLKLGEMISLPQVQDIKGE